MLLTFLSVSVNATACVPLRVKCYSSFPQGIPLYHMAFNDNLRRAPKRSILPLPVFVFMISSITLLKNLVNAGAIACCNRNLAGTQHQIKQAH